jgi:uncharacterized MAPEG superfamily protein
MALGETGEKDFRAERRKAILYIALAAPAAIVLWLAIDRFAPPLAGMDSLAARMVFTTKCSAVAVLLCLVTGVEAVAHERLMSPAFDPLSGLETRRLRVNQRYLHNTLEQTVVFIVALFGLTAYAPTGSAMRAVVATAVVWIVARFTFWIGYHRSAAMRGLGAPGMVMSMLVLLYVAARFGYEVAGMAGALAPVAIFIVLEAFLFWATSRSTIDR